MEPKIVEVKIIQCENGFFVQAVTSDSVVKLYVVKGVDELKDFIGDTYNARKPN